MKQLTLDIRPHLVPTLHNFIAGGNAQLLAALQAQADGQTLAATPPWLYIWGEAGSGRSHLVAAAAALTQRTVFTDPIGESQAGALYCIDDVEQLDEERLAALFRHQLHAPTMGLNLILSGPCPAQQLTLRQDVASRIAQGQIFQIQALSDEHKKAALHQHAQERGMRLPAELPDYLLRHGRRDLPWLMAVLDALDEISLSLGRPVTIPLYKEFIET